MKNKTRRISRILPTILAVMLCATVFPVTAFAGGTDPAPKPLPETASEATGGVEPDAEKPDKTNTAAAGKTEDNKTKSLTGKEAADLLSSLFGSKVSITATDDGIQITTSGTEETIQTGTVTTNGGKLNVRTGAGSFSLSLDEEELAALLGLFTGSQTGGGSAALTPDGNLTLIDDIGSTTQRGKQFITVETKTGNVFYLIIDRDDEGKETVHFLNQVDEADLLALMEDDQTGSTASVCTCTTKCKAGAVNTNCPVCKNNMSECTGPEPQETQPQETEAPQEEPKNSGSGVGGLIVFLVVALAGGGAALYYFKFKKPKADTKGSDDLDEYDFGDDEDFEDEAPEVENEQEDEE